MRWKLFSDHSYSLSSAERFSFSQFPSNWNPIVNLDWEEEDGAAAAAATAVVVVVLRTVCFCSKKRSENRQFRQASFLAPTQTAQCRIENPLIFGNLFFKRILKLGIGMAWNWDKSSSW